MPHCLRIWSEVLILRCRGVKYLLAQLSVGEYARNAYVGNALMDQMRSTVSGEVSLCAPPPVTDPVFPCYVGAYTILAQGFQLVSNFFDGKCLENLDYYNVHVCRDGFWMFFILLLASRRTWSCTSSLGWVLADSDPVSELSYSSYVLCYNLIIASVWLLFQADHYINQLYHLCTPPQKMLRVKSKNVLLSQCKAMSYRKWDRTPPQKYCTKTYCQLTDWFSKLQLTVYIMTHAVEDEVTDDDQIDYGLTAEDWQHVGRHSLPEVDQEILNLGGREREERGMRVREK